jgi:hypothetical protein
VCGAGGHAEAGYAPDPAAAANLGQLAESTGGHLYGDGDLGAASAAVRRAAEVGPVRQAARRETRRPLGPYLALAALALTAVLVAVRLRRPPLRMIRTYA